MKAMEQPQTTGLNGRHVLMMIVAFFVVIFGMNAVFLVEAIRTNSGIVANEPYRKGLTYNRRIEDDRRQHALGWQAQLSVDPSQMVVLEMTAADGTPLKGLSIEMTAGRPATMRENVSIKLHETSPGRYTADVALAGRGAFLADVTATSRDAELFRIRRRLWLAP